jgi:hypothetical protein
MAQPGAGGAASAAAGAGAATSAAAAGALDSSSSSSADHPNAAATTTTMPPSSSPQRREHSGVSIASNASANTTARTNASSSSSSSSSDRLADKAIAYVWVIAAVLVAWWSKTATVLLSPAYHYKGPGGPNRFLLCLLAVLLGMNTMFVLYLTVYLPRVKGLTDSSAWSVYCPSVIPTMTLTGLASFLLAVRATWPVWGFLAPLVLGVECLGLLFGLHFVPWF